MDSKEYIVPECNTMSTLTPKAPRNIEICIGAVKIEIKEEVDCMVEEESPCSGFKNSHKASEPTNQSKYVNYYDNNSSVLEQLKKEIPDSGYLQSDYSISSKLVFEDTNVLTLVNKQKEHIVYIKEELLNSAEENECAEYQESMKIERLKEQDILSNVGNSSVHYDVLVTPREVNCKMCGRKFKNSFNLIKHNSEHIEVIINRTNVNEINKLQQCKNYDKHFDNFKDMLSHVNDVHNKKQVNGEVCKKQFQSTLNVDKEKKSLSQVNGSSVECTYRNVDCNDDSILYIHTESCHTDIVNKKEKYKCTLCERFYISKQILSMHTRKAHNDYGRTFHCWCGEQFPTPMNLSEHKRSQHDSDGKHREFKCKCCEVVCREKSNLSLHMKKVHSDYGRAFECWCGKEFRTPKDLHEHKYLHVAGKSTHECRDKFHCDLCKKKFTTNRYLQRHMKSSHTDRGKEFECGGKQFNSLIQLSEHKSGEHESNINNANNDEFQCESCEKTFITKCDLEEHKKITHYNKEDTFKCCYGKKFSSSTQSDKHKSLQHRHNMNDTNDAKFPCNFCPKTFTKRRNLKDHTKRIHFEYDIAFKCWCGKEFRTPTHLKEHKKRHPVGKNINNTYNQKFQCDYCQIFIKGKICLLRHIENIHMNDAKAFAYRCRKKISDSKRAQRDANSKHASVEEFQCDYCQKSFKYKRYLVKHIRRSHYDYGNKLFNCFCGKSYRTPLHLYDHQMIQHKQHSV